MNTSKPEWETNAEISFLNKIGTWSPNTRHRLKSKTELVQEYLDAMPNRKNWGKMDRGRIEDHCYNMIAGRTS